MVSRNFFPLGLGVEDIEGLYRPSLHALSVKLDFAARSQMHSIEKHTQLILPGLENPSISIDESNTLMASLAGGLRVASVLGMQAITSHLPSFLGSSAYPTR